MILEFSMKLPSTSNKLRQIILDYENLPMFLPDQLKRNYYGGNVSFFISF